MFKTNSFLRDNYSFKGRQGVSGKLPAVIFDKLLYFWVRPQSHKRLGGRAIATILLRSRCYFQIPDTPAESASRAGGMLNHGSPGISLRAFIGRKCAQLRRALFCCCAQAFGLGAYGLCRVRGIANLTGRSTFLSRARTFNVKMYGYTAEEALSLGCARPSRHISYFDWSRNKPFRHKA